MRIAIVILSILGIVYTQVPASGLYVTLRNDALLALGEQISLQVSDLANTYLTTPQQSGTASEVTYVLNNFIYDTDIQNPVFSSSGKKNCNLMNKNRTWRNFHHLEQFSICHHCNFLFSHYFPYEKSLIT